MRALLGIVLLFLFTSISVTAQQDRGEVQFQLFDKDSSTPITRSYAYEDGYVHFSWSDPKRELMLNVLVVTETQSSYMIEGDSIRGFTLKKFPPKREARQLFSKAIPLGETKEIDGMKAELYYAPFEQESVKIWFTKEIDFDGKKFLPQDAIFEDFFVQMLSTDYGFPLEISVIKRKGEEIHFSKVKWIRKSLPDNYFSYMEANAREIGVVDNFSVDDLDLAPPEEPPVMEESSKPQKSKKTDIQVVDLAIEEEPEPVMEMEEEEEIFMVVEEMPQFPGGHQAMIEFVYENIQLPEEAQKIGKQGQAVVRFVVEKDGKISNIETIRDPGYGMGREAKRVVELMPQWAPGKQRGRPVRVMFTLPIRFKL